MSANFNPTLVQPILETPYLSLPDMIDAAAAPILDETGNPIHDEEGRLIYGA